MAYSDHHYQRTIMFIIAIVFVAITVVFAASLKAASIDHAANAAYREDYYANLTK